jgi:pyruvate dehydrogenase complex dehydrogenase (E1) component
MPTGWRRSAIAAEQPAWSTVRPAPVERLLAPLSRDARIITVMDGHPLALSWLGSVRGQRVVPLGIESFGQSGDIPDLYRAYSSMRQRSSTRWRAPSRLAA